jgi:hypothetical protein
MYKPQIIPEEASINASLQRLNPAEYSRKSFGMHGGEEMLVTLEARAELVDSVIDRFGLSPTFIKTDFGFRFSVRVMVSPSFYSWVMSFSGDMRIIAPSAAVRGISDMLDSIKRGYE